MKTPKIVRDSVYDIIGRPAHMRVRRVVVDKTGILFVQQIPTRRHKLWTLIKSVLFSPWMLLLIVVEVTAEVIQQTHHVLSDEFRTTWDTIEKHSPNHEKIVKILTDNDVHQQGLLD